jgi:hypothetical protein
MHGRLVDPALLASGLSAFFLNTIAPFVASAKAVEN